MTWLRTIGRWFDARLKVSESILPMLTHPIPRGAAGPMGWWYIFGSASLTFLLIQILTGIGLALVYVPAADAGFLFSDPTVGVDWPVAAEAAVTSDKDRALPSFTDLFAARSVR